MSNEELCALAKGGDTEARNRLLETNLSFIRQQANKIYGQSGSGRLDVDDLIQEGCLGLMVAINRFDPERGTKFLTYAVWWIRKFMQEAVNIVAASDAVSLDELEDFSSRRFTESRRSRSSCKRKPTLSYIAACGKSPPGSEPICSTATALPTGMNTPSRRRRHTSI